MAAGQAAGFNAGLEIAKSWYTLTARASRRFSALSGLISADIAIVGGGATGLSAALHAAEAGLSVVLVDGGRIGWGASGRQGGLMRPGLRPGAAQLVKAVGAERARALFELSLVARSLVIDLTERHAMGCDLRLTGHLTGAVRDGDIAGLEADQRALEDVMAYRGTKMLSAAETRGMVASDFCAGMIDSGGGHLHALDYVNGLARAAFAAGALLFEDSPAVGIDRDGAGMFVHTVNGRIRAKQVVLAGDAMLEGLSGRVNSRVMPVTSFVVTTARLPDPLAIIPSDVAVSDTRLSPSYCRLTRDRRLMFGCGERAGSTSPDDIKALVRPWLERRFPQLAGVALHHGWGGVSGTTRSRLPDLGRDGPLLWAHGYSGQGAVLATLAGALLAEAATGTTTRFDHFAGVAPKAFVGGAALRGPLFVLGLLGKAAREALRDRAEVPDYS